MSHNNTIVGYMYKHLNLPNDNYLQPLLSNCVNNIALADLICFPHAHSIWLAAGGFHINQSAPCFFKNDSTCLGSISRNAFLNSLSAATKLLPLSDLKYLKFPIWVMNGLKDWMNEFAHIWSPTSMWIVLMVRHVNMIPYHLISERFCFIQKNPNKSTLH